MSRVQSSFEPRNVATRLPATTSSLRIQNNDVMPHTLVKTSGPALAIVPAKLGHMGAVTKLTFSHPGVYRFVTKPGEDYMSGVNTVGEDNVLRLTVTVK
jgi:plastocyanin